MAPAGPGGDPAAPADVRLELRGAGKAVRRRCGQPEHVDLSDGVPKLRLEAPSVWLGEADAAVSVRCDPRLLLLELLFPAGAVRALLALLVAARRRRAPAGRAPAPADDCRR